MTDTTNPGEGRLQALLASVCDNLPVDWDEEDERATPIDKPLIRSLRELSQVAERNAGLLSAAAEFPEPGRYGRLELLAVLGSGTHGRVYHARDLLLDRDVAVKVLDTHAEDEVRLQEARRLASIRHPNVVTIHDVAAVAGRAALVMERLHGESLDRYAAEQGALDATTIASIGADLAEALGAVHASGLVHRDVKAQNVMREPSGRIVLMDLGPGLGTPRTMAPEVFLGRPPAPTSDIYSLGVLLYNLACDEFPVTGETLEALREAHRTGNMVPLEHRRPDLPAALLHVITRALEADPERRWPSTNEMAKAMREAPSRIRRGSVWRVGAVVGLLVVVAATWMLLARGAQHPKYTAAPGAGSASRAFTVDAAFYRGRGQRERLAEGDRVAPGDSVSLVLTTSDSLYVYVLNEDASGQIFLLFPAGGLSPPNPVPGGVPVVLPGLRKGETFYWQVTTAAEYEDLLVVACPAPLQQLESDLARLEPAREGTPVEFAPVGGESVDLLRGLGGLVGADPGGAEGAEVLAAGRFFQLAHPLALGPETVSGVWMRRLRLTSR